MTSLNTDVGDLLAAALALSIRFERDLGASGRQKRLYDLLIDYQAGEDLMTSRPQIRCDTCIGCHADTAGILRKFRA